MSVAWSIPQIRPLNVSPTPGKAVTTNLDKSLQLQAGNCWKTMKRSQVFHVDTYCLTVFSSKETATGKLSWGYLIHDAEMIPATSEILAQLCLTSLRIEGFLLLVWMTDLNLAAPLVQLLQLNEDKSVFLHYKHIKLYTVLRTRDGHTVRPLFLHCDQCNFASLGCQ